MKTKTEVGRMPGPRTTLSDLTKIEATLRSALVRKLVTEVRRVTGTEEIYEYETLLFLIESLDGQLPLADWTDVTRAVLRAMEESCGE